MDKCSICGGDEFKILGAARLDAAGAFDISRCGSCGVIGFSPLPTRAELSAFYSASYYDFDPGREEGKGRVFSRRLTQWKKNGTFLDIGCAEGFFLKGIRDSCGWKVMGLEFGGSAARNAREELGLDVYNGELDEAGFEHEAFDFININNVLEHVRDPFGMLTICRTLLKPGGMIRLSVPNGLNDSRTLIDYCAQEGKPAFSHKGHIFFFPAKTLLYMIERAEFKIVKKKTYGFKRGLRNAGIIPRKKAWRENHARNAPFSGDMPVKAAARSNQQRRPDIYYRWRFFSSELAMLPGLWKYGLDFIFILTPV